MGESDFQHFAVTKSGWLVRCTDIIFSVCLRKRV